MPVMSETATFGGAGRGVSVFETLRQSDEKFTPPRLFDSIVFVHCPLCKQ